MFMLLARPLFAVGLAVAAVFCVSPAWASQNDTAAPSYEALVSRLAVMPAVLEASALVDAAEARASQARALPNPSIGMEAENIYGSGPYRGTGSAETTISFTQPLELFGQRRARIDAARSEADAVGLQSIQRRWLAAGRLAQVYADAEAAQRRFVLAEEVLALTEEDTRAVASLVAEGREATLRGVQAQSEADAARASVDEARAIRDAAFARLSAIAMIDSVERIDDSLLDRELGPHAQHIETSLSERIAQAELNAAGRQIVVEQRRARPDISASLGQRRMRDTGEDTLTVGLSLSIPLFDRNRGGIRAAYADQRAAEARLASQQAESRADRLAANATLIASGSRTRAADSGVVAAEEAYRLARIGFDAGRISQLELRSTRAALVSARSTAVDARVARVIAEIELAGLEGRAPFGETR
ncbi:TolC family protein [Luteimonas sp. WGS1318]|uniref:TolC family protein n=1 Tax=Luteimonas sp. WGS1318 TaxID=3366815 RepID=UPI00372CF108